MSFPVLQDDAIQKIRRLERDNLSMHYLTEADLGTNIIYNYHITTGSVTSDSIANATITAGDISNATITATQIANATITTTQIANATILGTNIASATISGSNIQNATITGTQIQDGSITGTDIASATITGGNIGSATIQGSNIVNATITGGLIASTTITAGNIVNNTITASQIQNNTITATQIASNTITSAQITDLTITSAEIADLTITGAKIAAATLTADKITVTSLSALSANLGTITAGTITGATFQTSASNPRVYMDATGVGAVDSGAVTTFKLDASTGKLTTLVGVGGANLLKNSSFEAATLQNWTIHNGTVALDATTAFTGTKSAKFGPAAAPNQLRQDVTFSSPRTVVASAYVKISNRTSGDVFLNIFDGVGWTESAHLTANTDWTRITHTFNASGTVQIYLQDSLDSSATAWFDAVQLEVGSFATAYGPKPDEVLPDTVTNVEIAPNTITNAEILANTITAAQIAATTITAGEIASNTITATQIAASTITATQIATGTITGTQIAAGTITADKITVTTASGFNTINDSSFEVDGVVNFAFGSATLTLGTATSGLPHGTKYAILTSTATGIPAELREPGGSAEALPNQKWTASAFVKAPSATRLVQVGAMFYNSSKSQVGMSPGRTIGATSAVTTSTTWQRVHFTVTTPANTAYVAFVMEFLNPNSGEVFHIDAIQLSQGDILSSWQQRLDPTVIDGGTVTGGIIRTAVSGARVELNSEGLQSFDSGENIVAKISSSGGELAVDAATFTSALSNPTFTNPSFTTDTTGWTTINGTATRDTGVFDSSPASLRLLASTTPGTKVETTFTGASNFLAGSTYIVRYRFSNVNVSQQFAHEFAFGNIAGGDFTRNAYGHFEAPDTNFRDRYIAWTPKANTSSANVKLTLQWYRIGGVDRNLYVDSFELYSLYGSNMPSNKSIAISDIVDSNWDTFRIYSATAPATSETALPAHMTRLVTPNGSPTVPTSIMLGVETGFNERQFTGLVVDAGYGVATAGVGDSTNQRILLRRTDSSGHTEKLLLDAEDNSDFLLNTAKPQARMSKNTDTTIANNTSVALTFNTSDFDTGVPSAQFDDTNDRLTCRVAGLYVVTLLIEWATNSSGTRSARIRKVGQLIAVDQKAAAISPDVTVHAVTAITHMAVNDYITAEVRQGSGGNLNITAAGTDSTAYRQSLAFAWISP